MSSNQTPVSRPIFQRFLDSFLQDRNINWMLMVGMLILLGSSLLLVSAHWDAYTPVWKYVLFLGYTAGTFGIGQWTRYRLGLQRTATVLQVLTVLLIPITFVVLHWVERQETGALGHGFHLILGGVNILFAMFAARAIFHHFLCGHQPTFVASYLLLALAGALVPGLPESWAPVVVLVLWGIFAVGSVKVNRHVFWLTEEHRLPRTCGFLPILLLGAQFFMVFALYAPTFGLDWLGVGAVLIAVPVLLTADAVAWVFQKRTGDLVRPLPWTIIGPLVVGLVLCAGGVILAGTSVLPPNRPYALVLASALAAILMAVVGRRTSKEAFVWAMLGGVALAYNFSPAFFADLARGLLTQGARVVHEEKLPYAFYGLTYLPLLLAVMVGGWTHNRRGDALFARPLQVLAIALASLMLAVSFGHLKALVPVALVMTCLFALQVVLFRDGRLVFLAITSWIIGAGWFAVFADGVLGWSMPAAAALAFLAMAAFTLLVAGLALDELNARLLPAGLATSNALIAKLWQAPCQSASLIMTLGLSGYWFARQAVLSLDPMIWPYALPMTALLLAQASRWWRQPAIRYPVLMLINWQVLSLTVLLFGPPLRALVDLQYQHCVALCLPLAVVAAASLLVWQIWEGSRSAPWQAIVGVHLGALRLVAVVALCGTIKLQTELSAGDVGMAASGFLLACLGELCSACRRQREERVWIAMGVALAAAGYFIFFRVIPLGHGAAMFAVLGLGVLLWLVGECVSQRYRLEILRRPLQQLALVLPVATVSLGVYRHLFEQPAWLGANSLALLLAAGFYFWRGLERSSKSMLILSGLILNVALVVLWRDLAWDDPQFFMIPVGISILALVQLLKAEIPERFHNSLRYLGALVILISPTFHIVGGSWLHLFSLMLVSVAVMLVAMGLRVRALIYTGTAFLVADLVAMVVRGSIDNPSVLWLAGLTLGAAVIALGAVCERNREALVARIRVLGETLKQWN